MYLIYTKDDCPYCILAKGIMDGRGIEYEEIRVGSEEFPVEEFRRVFHTQGIRTVPQVFNGEQRIGGYEDLAKYFKELDADTKKSSEG